MRCHSPVDLVLAVAVDAGVADALVDLREAGGVVVALGALAGEAVDGVDAGAAVVAGVLGALVDVDVAHRSWRRTQKVSVLAASAEITSWPVRSREAHPKRKNRPPAGRYRYPPKCGNIYRRELNGTVGFVGGAVRVFTSFRLQTAQRKPRTTTLTKTVQT